MQIRNDEQFEAYLKKFRPLAPSPLREARSYRTRRLSAIAKWALASAATIAAVALGFHLRSRVTHVPENAGGGIAAIGKGPIPQALTMRGAADLLESTGSLEAALDDVAFQPRVIPIAKEKSRSALAARSEEENKP